MLKEITVKNFTLQYELTFKKVKNINIRITPDKRVMVSANRFVSEGAVEEFIISKIEFIKKALAKYEQSSQFTFSDNEKVSILGKEKTLITVKRSKNYVSVTEDFLIISVTDTEDTALKKKTFEKWLKKEAEVFIKEICESVYPDFKEVTPFPVLKFRKMKTRWGSCQPNKNILTFNTMLLLTPFECIKYVVIHEFCHFICPDHSKKFYNNLSRFMPDYKIHREKLKSYNIYF